MDVYISNERGEFNHYTVEELIEKKADMPEGGQIEELREEVRIHRELIAKLILELPADRVQEFIRENLKPWGADIRF